ncbi:hypothetical protein [Oecophyllibacter saccharovorans]|uniref:hypothetical protein n=1 Tax=Oecophyllibacter saccharovorans TaxID=2558360 RepID=UPI0018A2B730|nr:hypothetical protein [Oecophyllibacter saccharovorans]
MKRSRTAGNQAGNRPHLSVSGDLLRMLRALGLASVSLVCIPLGGCGFKPLYGHARGTNSTVSAQMQNVFVANTGGGRFGQVLRLGLQQEMAGPSSAPPSGYTLNAWGNVSFEAIDIHEDNTSGRMRMLGTANWQLFTVGVHPKLLAQGHTSTLDGFNPLIDQTFAQTLNAETGTERVAKNLAHQISEQVAIWFRSHQSLGAIDTAHPEMYLNAADTGSGGARYQQLGADGFPAAATGRTSGQSTDATLTAMPDIDTGGPAGTPGHPLGNGTTGGNRNGPSGQPRGSSADSGAMPDGAYNAGPDGLPEGPGSQ